jgi:hypothetical protein
MSGERSEDDELRDYDPTQEGGGGPCERCGYEQEPWRFSRLCQACIWDSADSESREETP